MRTYRLNIALRAAIVWFGIACLAVCNGLLRDSLLVPALGERTALSVSGLLLSGIVFGVTWLAFRFLGARLSRRAYLMIGAQWVCMTLLLDSALGGLRGQTWREFLQVFDVSAGNLFVLVLLASLLAPLTVARIKRAV
ncbi:MAG: hypothetical protein R3E54_18240 [Halioglobus sp.]